MANHSIALINKSKYSTRNVNATIKDILSTYPELNGEYNSRLRAWTISVKNFPLGFAFYLWLNPKDKPKPTVEFRQPHNFFVFWLCWEIQQELARRLKATIREEFDGKVVQPKKKGFKTFAQFLRHCSSSKQQSMYELMVLKEILRLFKKHQKNRTPRLIATFTDKTTNDTSGKTKANRNSTTKKRTSSTPVRTKQDPIRNDRNRQPRRSNRSH